MVYTALTSISQTVAHLAKKQLAIFCVIYGILSVGTISDARSELQIESWENYGYLAEQGAICASFSGLMASQSVLNPDIGKLWQERRKYAGAVIRKATEFELKRTPDDDEITLLINHYSDWVVDSLMSKDLDGLSLQEAKGSKAIIGQQKMQKLIDSYCRTMFAQGDRQILASNADLAYLLRPASTSKSNPTPSDKQITLNLGQGASVSLSLPSSANMPPSGGSAIIATPPAKTEHASNDDTTLDIVRLLQLDAPPKTSKQTSKQTSNNIVAPNSNQKTKKPITPKIEPPLQGELILQLGSFSQKQNAETNLQKLQQTYPDMLQHIILNINEHRLTTGSLFYRVETQKLDQKTAQIICDFLWTERLPCLLKSV